MEENVGFGYGEERRRENEEKNENEKCGIFNGGVRVV